MAHPWQSTHSSETAGSHGPTARALIAGPTARDTHAACRGEFLQLYGAPPPKTIKLNIPTKTTPSPNPEPTPAPHAIARARVAQVQSSLDSTRESATPPGRQRGDATAQIGRGGWRRRRPFRRCS
jgi:hypothetical protein